MRVMCQQRVLEVTARRQQRAVAVQIVLVHGNRDRLTGLGNRAWRGPQGEGGPKPGIEITITECLLERGEGRLAGAVPGRDVNYVELNR